MIALLLCRRLAHPYLEQFLNDESQAIRNEAVSAIYDTDALDGPSGKQLVLLNLEEFPFYQQMRLIASYFRLGLNQRLALLAYVRTRNLMRRLESLLWKHYRDGQCQRILTQF